ncbi:MAG: PQQ-like beta-propeller repeat protein [Actinobacteria bacterium]|nr:PQQ-like beta-propeller repeat protein [Actinomycetota bacterium]
MQRRGRPRAASFILLIPAALGISATAAAAQQEVTAPWGQFQAGPTHAGSLPDGPQPPYRLRWTRPSPAGGALSPPIVVGDEVVSVGSQAVYGIDLATGEVTWQIPRAGGPVSTPAVASLGGRDLLVYLEGPAPVGSAMPSPSVSATVSPSATDAPSPTASASPGVEGGHPDRVSFLVAVDLSDRSELWRTALDATAQSGVTIEGGTAYVGDRGGDVYAADLDDGSFVWASPAAGPGQVDAPVAVVDGAVYVVRRDPDTGLSTLMAFDAATGERRWPAGGEDAAPTGGSAPAVIDGTVIVGSTDPAVRAFAAADGELRWSALATSRSSPFTSPAVAEEGAVLAGLSGGLYLLDPAEGQRRWSYQFNEVVIRSSPVVSGSTVLLGLDDGRLVAVDAGVGHLVWQSAPASDPLGAIALSTDVVVAVRHGRGASLVAFEHDPEGALIDERSPTELEAGTTFGRYALAAVLVFALASIPGVLFARRAGPAKLEASTEVAADEASDLDDADGTGESDEDDRAGDPDEDR